MGTKYTRQQKAGWIEKQIDEARKKNQHYIVLDKFLARFAHELGTTERTGLEILHMMEKLGYIWVSKKSNELMI